MVCRRSCRCFLRSAAASLKKNEVVVFFFDGGVRKGCHPRGDCELSFSLFSGSKKAVRIDDTWNTVRRVVLVCLMDGTHRRNLS